MGVKNKVKKDLTNNYEENLAAIEDKFTDCPDVIERKLNLKNGIRYILLLK